MLKMLALEIASRWYVCFLLLTGVELFLGWLSILIAREIPQQDHLWSDSSNWDAISAGITLLLATYLPVELSKHADCLTAFQKVNSKLHALEQRKDALVKQKNTAQDRDEFVNNTEALKKEILKAPMNYVSVQTALDTVYNEMDQEDEINMDRYVELEDSIVELKGKRDYDVPVVYQTVMLAVTVFYYGCILPAVRSQGERRYLALYDVAFVGGINNLILSVAFRSASMFRLQGTPDFKRAKDIFSGVGNTSLVVKRAKASGYVYYPRVY